MEVELQSKVQERDQQVKKLHENVATLKEMHKAELEELKREVEKQVFVTQGCIDYAKDCMWVQLLWCTHGLFVMLAKTDRAVLNSYGRYKVQQLRWSLIGA